MAVCTNTVTTGTGQINYKFTKKNTKKNIEQLFPEIIEPPYSGFLFGGEHRIKNYTGKKKMSLNFW